MSAAEKLRTMYAQESSSPYDEGAETGLFDALPEIIAVVEAAEEGYSVDAETDVWIACGACHAIIWKGHRPDCALVALSAKLEKR